MSADADSLFQYNITRLVEELNVSGAFPLRAALCIVSRIPFGIFGIDVLIKIAGNQDALGIAEQTLRRGG